jgi:hypothetical protein
MRYIITIIALITIASAHAMVDYDTFTRDGPAIGNTEGLNASWTVQGTANLSDGSIHLYDEGIVSLDMANSTGITFYATVTTDNNLGSTSIVGWDGYGGVGSESCKYICDGTSSTVNLNGYGTSIPCNVTHEVRIYMDGENCTYIVDGTPYTNPAAGTTIYSFGYYATNGGILSSSEMAYCGGYDPTCGDGLGIDECEPAWECSSFTDCLVDGYEHCLAMVDSEGCNETFTGDLNSYDVACEYCAPAWQASWERSECVGSTYSTQLVYLDANRCGSSLGIPGDNGTDYYGRCTVSKAGIIKFRDINSIDEVGDLEISFTATVDYDGNLSVTELEQLPTSTLDLGIGSKVKKVVDIGFDPVFNDFTSALIQIYYSKAEIQGMSEKDLKLYFKNETSGLWVVVPGSGVNMTGDYVFGEVTHFSYYGIGGNVSYYDATDLPEIGTDMLGEAMVGFKPWVGLLILVGIAMSLVTALVLFGRTMRK